MNITKLTEEYIQSHPSIKDGVQKGLINYSALTRRIAAEMSLNLKDNFDAILIACRRYYQKVKKEAVSEMKILDILRESKLEVKNKVIVAVVEKDVYFSHILELHKSVKSKAELFHVIEGSNSITLITTEEFTADVKKLFKNKVIKLTKALAEITLRSSTELENTPGVVAYLFSLFASHGINIIETMSTYTDTLFVIDEKDIARVLELLHF